MLELCRIGFELPGERWLFRGIDCCLRPPMQIAICGESGSGKSSLLNLMAGLEQPTEGKVTWMGQSISDMSLSERLNFRRSALGFVFQAFHLVSHLSALQNVMLPCLLNNWSQERSQAAAIKLLERLGLAARAGDFPRTLSGGEQQRVALARALVHSPKIVLADEPTGNLDPGAANLALETLSRLCREQDAILVMVTHSERAAMLLDEQWRLDDGRLIRLNDGDQRTSKAGSDNGDTDEDFVRNTDARA